MSDQRAAQIRAFLDHPLVRIPVGVVVACAMSLVIWLGMRSVEKLDAMESQVAALSTSLARLETLYQAQVPDLSARLEAVEKDLRVLRWEIEMDGYHRARTTEEAERERWHDDRQARQQRRH